MKAIQKRKEIIQYLNRMKATKDNPKYVYGCDYRIANKMYNEGILGRSYIFHNLEPNITIWPDYKFWVK